MRPRFPRLGHGTLSANLIDRIGMRLGVSLVMIAPVLTVYRGAPAGLVLTVGGLGLATFAEWDRRKREHTAWALAAISDDPIAYMAGYEYLCDQPLHDVLVVARWIERGCQHVDCTPSQVRAMREHLTRFG